MKKYCALFVAASFVAVVSTQAQGTILTGKISFDNLVWNGGSVSSGYFEYTYDNTSGSLVSIVAVNIGTVAGGSIPSFQLVNSVPDVTDNASLGFDYNNAGAQKYEAYFEDASTGNEQIFLDWTGLGDTAQLVATTPGNVASISANGGSSYYSPSQIGTSTGSVVTVPEPATLALIGVGGMGLLGQCRRRK